MWQILLLIWECHRIQTIRKKRKTTRPKELVECWEKNLGQSPGKPLSFKTFLGKHDRAKRTQEPDVRAMILAQTHSILQSNHLLSLPQSLYPHNGCGNPCPTCFHKLVVRVKCSESMEVVQMIEFVQHKMFLCIRIQKGIVAGLNLKEFKKYLIF